MFFFNFRRSDSLSKLLTHFRGVVCTIVCVSFSNGPITCRTRENGKKIQIKDQIAIGGEWYLKRRKPHQTRLLLVAGGVGINPILAMLRHLAHMDDAWERGLILSYHVNRIKKTVIIKSLRKSAELTWCTRLEIGMIFCTRKKCSSSCDTCHSSMRRFIWPIVTSSNPLRRLTVSVYNRDGLRKSTWPGYLAKILLPIYAARHFFQKHCRKCWPALLMKSTLRSGGDIAILYTRIYLSYRTKFNSNFTVKIRIQKAPCRTIRAKLSICTSHASAPPPTAWSAPRTSPQSRSTSPMLTHRPDACSAPPRFEIFLIDILIYACVPIRRSLSVAPSAAWASPTIPSIVLPVRMAWPNKQNQLDNQLQWWVLITVHWMQSSELNISAF